MRYNLVFLVLISVQTLVWQVFSQSDDFMGNFLPDGVNIEKQKRQQRAIKMADLGVDIDEKVAMNEEMIAVEAGRADFLKALANRKKLLCVTFLNVKERAVSLFVGNIGLMGEHCDWAAVFYDGSPTDISSTCSKFATSLNSTSSNALARPELVHCKRAPDTLDRPVTMIPKKDGSFIQQTVSVPKSALYAELLPYIPHYTNVFVMDEDISLQGFDVVRFMRIWKCSFNADYRPLIVQPLIAERTQYFPYVHLDAWTRAKGRVYASSVGLVEQQVPFFDATFLEWFIKHVLSQTRDAGLLQGVDQSLDRTWCRAADLYALQMLRQNYTKRGDACAVIVGGANLTAVHHLNTKALENKRTNRDLYRQKAQAVHERYKTLYPTWVQPEIRRSINPLDKKYGRRYRKYLSLNNRCVEAAEAHNDIL